MPEQHPERRGKAAAKLTHAESLRDGTSARHRYGAAVKTQKTREITEERREERERSGLRALQRVLKEEKNNRGRASVKADCLRSSSWTSSLPLALFVPLILQLGCRHGGFFSFPNKSLFVIIRKVSFSFKSRAGVIVAMATKQTQRRGRRGRGPNAPTLLLLGVPPDFWFLHLGPNPEPDSRSELRESVFTVKTLFW